MGVKGPLNTEILLICYKGKVLCKIQCLIALPISHCSCGTPVFTRHCQEIAWIHGHSHFKPNTDLLLWIISTVDFGTPMYLINYSMVNPEVKDLQFQNKAISISILSSRLHSFLFMWTKSTILLPYCSTTAELPHCLNYFPSKLISNMQLSLK